LLGSWLSGSVVDAYARTTASGAGGHDWHAIWLIAAVCSAAVLALFMLTFSDKQRAPARDALAQQHS
jgi:hypothetical protein